MVDGRRRYLHGEKERHTTFCNNTVQGSCASVMKLAMYGIHQQLKTLTQQQGSWLRSTMNYSSRWQKIS